MTEFMALGENLTGFNEDDKGLIIEYVKNLETGLTSDHCLCQWIPLDGKKRLRGSVHMDCPVHTREGLILGFLKYTSKLNENESDEHSV